MQLQAIKAASLLHDVGKLAVPEHILNKPGKLTPSEFEVMKRHAPVGADILSMIEFPYPVVPIVRHHHENWDGTGYPDGLSGEQIPIGARILQVVDCFDALTSDRPYRPRMETADALKILKDRRGVMYDPRIVDAFVEIHSAQSTEPGQSSAGSGTAPPAPAVLEAAPPIAGGHDMAGQQYLELFYELGGALKNPASLSSIGKTLWDHLEPHMPAGAFVFFSYSEPLDALLPCYQGGAINMSADTRVPLGSRVADGPQPIARRLSMPMRASISNPMCTQHDSAQRPGRPRLYRRSLSGRARVLLDRDRRLYRPASPTCRGGRPSRSSMCLPRSRPSRASPRPVVFQRGTSCAEPDDHRQPAALQRFSAVPFPELCCTRAQITIVCAARSRAPFRGARARKSLCSI